MWKYILFDLDGTITNSGEGIMNCIRYALEQMGREIPAEQTLRKFVGPPLVVGFREYTDLTEEEAKTATAKYRERYQSEGLFEAYVYEGFEAVLKYLKKTQVKIAVATSKPEEYTERILEHFHLKEYFDVIAGDTLKGDRGSKQAVVEEALRRLNVTEQDKGTVLMVGDRKYDVIGAKSCGIRSLGVYYGYAETGELEEAGADYVVRTTADMLEWFEQQIPETPCQAMSDVDNTQQPASSQISSYNRKIGKKWTAIAGGMLILGIALGVGGTLLVQKQPWSKITQENTGADYDANKCVRLGDYKGIKVSLAVTDDDVQQEIDGLIQDNVTYEQKKGTVQEDDKIYAKFNGYIDGKKVDDTCGEEVIELGSDQFVKGFESAFVGAKTGKQITFKINIPKETYGDDTIDGKEVTFKATVKYICGDEIVPTWNDKFVQSISDFKTAKEYEADIRTELAKENENNKQDFAWTEVLENAKVKKYPEELLEDAKQEVLQGYYDMADMYGMSHDEIFQSWGSENEEDFVKNELDEQAKQAVKEKLVVEAIAKAEGINYSDKEYKDLVAEEYQYNTEKYDSEAEYEKKNRESLKDNALSSAVQKWIAKHATFSK